MGEEEAKKIVDLLMPFVVEHGEYNAVKMKRFCNYYIDAIRPFIEETKAMKDTMAKTIDDLREELDLVRRQLYALQEDKMHQLYVKRCMALHGEPFQGDLPLDEDSVDYHPV